MKANPGGGLDPDEIRGRDELIRQIWDILEKQSIYMNAERRIGKTSILVKLADHPPDGWEVSKKDLEATHSCEEFARTIYEAVEAFLGRMKKVARRSRELLQGLGGTEIGGLMKLPEGTNASWKDLIQRSVADLADGMAKNDRRLLFLWDEVPHMIDSIRRREGEEQAMALLDLLRLLRQSHPKSLRMVLTGSIGLHHVLAALKKSAYGNEPVNDMAPVSVPPLDAESGQRLARDLLRGEGIEVDDLDEVAAAISAAVDHFPFYIHHVVRKLKFSGREATPEEIERSVTEQLQDPDDPWELRHYRTRLDQYYEERARLATLVLDSIAVADGIDLDALTREVKNQQDCDKEDVRELLVLLQRDHYLVREGVTYRFLFPLIQRWWREDRGL